MADRHHLQAPCILRPHAAQEHAPLMPPHAAWLTLVVALPSALTLSFPTATRAFSSMARAASCCLMTLSLRSAMRPGGPSAEFSSNVASTSPTLGTT